MWDEAESVVREQEPRYVYMQRRFHGELTQVRANDTKRRHRD